MVFSVNDPKFSHSSLLGGPQENKCAKSSVNSLKSEPLGFVEQILHRWEAIQVIHPTASKH